jgi:hypothetical protein
MRLDPSQGDVIVMNQIACRLSGAKRKSYTQFETYRL